MTLWRRLAGIVQRYREVKVDRAWQGDSERGFWGT